jgi:PAS domain S-box-containing protein
MVVSCGVVLYLGLLILLYDTLGNMMLALSFLPVALAGWLMGLRVSLVVSLLTFSTTTLFLRFFTGTETTIASVIVAFVALMLVSVTVGRLRDLQERSRAELEARSEMERALRESEERYIDLFENANDIIFTVGLDGNFTSANRVAFEALGYDRDEISGARLFDILTPKSAQFALEMLQRGVTEGSDLSELQPWELEVYRKDGSLRIVEVRTRLIRDGGDVEGFQGIARDVTEREQTMRRTMALAEAAATVTSTLDFEQVLDRILTQVDRVVPNDAANIMLIEDGRATIAGWHGYERFNAEEFVSSVAFDMDDMVILRRMVEAQEPAVVADTSTHPDWIHMPGQQWLLSFASAPIRVKGEVVGFLNVDSSVPNFFSTADAQTLQLFADYAAIAIDNARLFEAANQRVLELEAVRQAALSLTSSLELEAVLEVILESTLRFLPGAQNSHVFLYQGRRLRFGAALWADGHRGQPVAMPRPDGLTYTVARDAKTIIVPNMRTHPLFVGTPPDWNGAIVGLPLQIAGRVVGVMNISYQEPREFSENELHMLQLFGDQAAIAIENARLFESEQRQTRRLSLMADAARVVATTLDQDILLQEVADIIFRHFGYQSVMLFLPDVEGTMMVMRGRAGEWAGPPEVSSPGLYQQPVGLGIVGHVARTGQSYLSTDVESDPYHYSPDQVVVRSEVCVPILEDGRVIGVIDVESDQLGAFGPQDRSLLEAVADTVSIGVRNARLFTEARTRAEELAAALARLEELDRLKDEFIQNVSHELRSPLALIRGYAEMLDAGHLGEVLPAQQKPLSIIARRSRMLGDLVSDITLILEAEASPPEPDEVHLDELAQAAVEDFQITARQEGLTLRADITPRVPSVQIPANYMRRVLDNLLGNAVKFTPDQGTVTVRVWSADDLVVLEVSDTGIGISPEELARVFDRFYQVDGSARRRYGGVGLGLSLVKELIETYGGSVGVASELNEGTTFSVRLPAATA